MNEKKKIGRPRVENKKVTATFRVELSDVEHLKRYAEQEGISRSEIIRRSINELKIN